MKLVFTPVRSRLLLSSFHYDISYSNMSIVDAGKRLGFWIDQLEGTPVAQMLANEKVNLDGEGMLS